jgi:hypothetical protein
MFRPNWPSSGVHYIRLLLSCNVVFTALASDSYFCCVVYGSVCGCLECSCWIMSVLSKSYVQVFLHMYTCSQVGWSSVEVNAEGMKK